MHTQSSSHVAATSSSYPGSSHGEGRMNDASGETAQESEVVGYLLGLCGPATGMLVPLSEGSHIIGRGTYATIYLQDDRVSREHTLVLVGAGGSVMLIDLHAGNGTRVNNAKITKVVLRDGDRIEVGNSNFSFTSDPPTDATMQTGE